MNSSPRSLPAINEGNIPGGTHAVQHTLAITYDSFTIMLRTMFGFLTSETSSTPEHLAQPLSQLWSAFEGKLQPVTRRWHWHRPDSDHADDLLKRYNETDQDGEIGSDLENSAVGSWFRDHYVLTMPLSCDGLHEVHGPKLDQYWRLMSPNLKAQSSQLPISDLECLEHQMARAVRCYRYDLFSSADSPGKPDSSTLEPPGQPDSKPSEPPGQPVSKPSELLLTTKQFRKLLLRHLETLRHMPKLPGIGALELSDAYLNTHAALQSIDAENDAAKSGELFQRLFDYPKGVHVDLAYTVVAEGFYEALARRLGDDQLEGDKYYQNMRFFLDDKPEQDLAYDGEGQQSRPRFHLPVLLITHQQVGTVPTVAARNQQRVAVASAAWFLGMMGIRDFPVYGLLVCNRRGYLSQAWYSKDDKCCYLVDRNISEFPLDLTKEDRVLRYLTFMYQIGEHAKELKNRFAEVKDEILARVEQRNDVIGLLQLCWGSSSQLVEYASE
ncbi:hypothetical protein BD311DRAFT_837952 [Dichomitus squalens]|uniref:Uncharacterized protein n=1 Tax=Dichomitus squalens TaxID=114155 RepID=A0A4Q9MQS4_9APHY|nr:hypothetical protein BD311DRAFT_837952 [Dichomitus squalens]